MRCVENQILIYLKNIKLLSRILYQQDNNEGLF